MSTMCWSPLLEDYQERGSVINSAHYSEMLVDILNPTNHSKLSRWQFTCPFILSPVFSTQGDIKRPSIHLGQRAAENGACRDALLKLTKAVTYKKLKMFFSEGVTQLAWFWQKCLKCMGITLMKPLSVFIDIQFTAILQIIIIDLSL